MKPTRFNRFTAAAIVLFPGCLFAADRIRNNTNNSLNLQDAWGDGLSGTPGLADRAVWNSSSLGGATTLGADLSWSGILVGSATPSSGPTFTNAVNPSPFKLTLGAGGIDLNGGGSTNRGISFESNTTVELGANQTWKLGAGGTSANILASSVISGANSLEITRGATASNYAQFSGANTFSGGMTVGSNAWVRVGANAVTSGLTVSSSAIGTGNLTIQDGALLTTTGGTGQLIAAPQINLLGNATLNQNIGANGRLQFAGTWDLGNGTRTLTIERTVAGFASGNEGLGFTQPSGFGAPTIKNGSLVLATISGSASNPAKARINSTTSFEGNVGLTLGDGVALTSSTSNPFPTSATNSPALTLAAPDTKGGGVLQLGDGSATMRNAPVYSLAGGGTISSSNTTTAGQTGTVTVYHGNNAEFSGNITEGGPGLIAFTKTGAGTQTLSGTNSYSGKTTVSGGILRFGKRSALYNANTGSWTTTNLQVDSTATLALNVGGAGEFTAADIQTLSSLGTSTAGFKAGSRLGIDTTNAGGNFTYSNVIANTNGGSNAIGLRKLGSGTLTLDQVNTYTGGTIIDGGTVKIVQPGGIHTGALTVNAGGTFEADFSGLAIAGQVTNTSTGTGTIQATPPNASQLSFTSGSVSGFQGTINIKPSPSNNGRVDFNGLTGSGASLNIDTGATARLANSGTYNDLTINVTGSGGSGPGALRMESGTLSSSCAVNLLGNASIGGFTVTSNIAAVIADGGNGYSLTKSGDSTLSLTGVNTYTGDTLVNGGKLRISNPYLANASGIVIGATSVLDLNFDESGGEVSDTVNTLTIGGVQQPAGVYGASGSGATTINDTNFAGSGTLTVLNGPAAANDYAAWASANGITGGASGDSDNDGVSNLVEYALINGGERGSLSGNTITFTKRGAPYGSDITYAIETSETLVTGSWTQEVTGGSPTAISYTFTPGSPVKKFARLKVVQVP